MNNTKDENEVLANKYKSIIRIYEKYIDYIYLIKLERHNKGIRCKFFILSNQKDTIKEFDVNSYQIE